jgi:hypothetical protein
MLKHAARKRPNMDQEALKVLEATEFNCAQNLRMLTGMYRGLPPAAA